MPPEREGFTPEETQVSPEIKKLREEYGKDIIGEEFHRDLKSLFERVPLLRTMVMMRFYRSTSGYSRNFNFIGRFI